MKQNWDKDKSIECWTLTESEKKLLPQWIWRNQLGFTILSKFFQVKGTNQYCNPDDDLPAGFADKRAEYYETLYQPNDADRFIKALQQSI